MLRPESSLSATVVVVDKTGNGPWRAKPRGLVTGRVPLRWVRFELGAGEPG